MGPKYRTIARRVEFVVGDGNGHHPEVEYRTVVIEAKYYREALTP